MFPNPPVVLFVYRICNCQALAADCYIDTCRSVLSVGPNSSGVHNSSWPAWRRLPPRATATRRRVLVGSTGRRVVTRPVFLRPSPDLCAARHLTSMHAIQIVLPGACLYGPWGCRLQISNRIQLAYQMNPLTETYSASKTRYV